MPKQVLSGHVDIQAIMSFNTTQVTEARSRIPTYGMGNTRLTTTPTIERVLFAFAGAALYNMVELLVQIPLRFKIRRGLYFWSLLLSAIGVLPYTLGLLFKFFGVISGQPEVFVAIALIAVGWQLMVTGQSFVLYSRLHLICRNHKTIRAVLCMIFFNFIVANVPTIILLSGASGPHPGNWALVYGVWERLQLCLYFTQEVVISAIYCFEIVRMLRPIQLDIETAPISNGSDSSSRVLRRMSDDKNKRVLRHLLWINGVIVALDITLLVTEFIGHYEIQVLYKAFVYSIKLKMEFRILNQLTDIAQTQLRNSQARFDSNESADSFQGRGEGTKNLCHPAGSSQGNSWRWPMKRTNTVREGEKDTIVPMKEMSEPTFASPTTSLDNGK